LLNFVEYSIKTTIYKITNTLLDSLYENRLAILKSQIYDTPVSLLGTAEEVKIDRDFYFTMRLEQ